MSNLELPLGDSPLSVERPHPVGAVVAAAREAIEAVFRNLWVEGEVSELKAVPSGVWYLTLLGAEKEPLRGVVFKFEAKKLARTLKELKPGTQVYARGDLSVSKRSELQLFVRELLPRPEGGFYQLQFERAHAALLKDGLLDPARKRALPRFPRRIAVVTSPEGAVWHDIVTTVARRWPFVELIRIAAKVQGDGAPASLCRALLLAAKLEGLDVIIVARGGGSKEELSCFNDEQVARAVAAAHVPVISAVGHETDVTLTDLVADARAPTPTGAAQMAVPDRAAVAGEIGALEAALGRAVARTVESAGFRVAQAAHRVDALVAGRVARAERRADAAGQRMLSLVETRLALRASGIARLGASLDSLSPLAVLGRGYSVARDEAGKVLRRRGDFAPGAPFRLRVVDGDVGARVEKTA